MTPIQSPEHSKIGTVRRGRRNGNPGVWYGARVCILVHERGPVRGGCALLFGIQTAFGAHSGLGCRLIPNVESDRGEPDGLMRPFPATRAWQGMASSVVAGAEKGL